MKRAGDADGILLLRKESGATSFEALSSVKRALGTGRVGHTGTLDKFARGLLVVLAGRSTKLVPYFTGCDKTYEGTILFGAETDTLDPEGSVVAEAPPPSGEVLEACLDAFRGNIMQAPPLYSAVHVDGRRAHEIARSGGEAEMARRPITIHALELLSYDGLRADIRVRCSKGTYIRSLARDIALAANSRAHLIALNRLQVASFSLDAAARMSDDLSAALRPVERGDFEGIGIACFRVGQATERDLIHGKPIREEDLEPLGARSAAAVDRAAVFSASGSLVAVLERLGASWRYGFVYGRP